jgi:hypothetical protein
MNERLGTSVVVALALGLGSCGDDGGNASDTSAGSSTTGINVTETDTDASGGTMKFDIGQDTTGMPPACAGDGSCTGLIDLLFVIDNSGSMGEEQLNLARNLPLLIQQLEMLQDSEGNPVAADVNIMVTTTDSGNPLCDPFYKPGRTPENGAPISDACTARIDRFTGLGMDPVVMEEACTMVCPNPVAPMGDFIHFDGSGSNIPDTPPADVNGDGIDDSDVAQALACVGPQGIDGCGYESPLASMRAALDPMAAWNGAGGFLRPGSLLAVAVITDEADCSLADETIMSDDSLYETNPDTMMALPTSAVCWNAGVTCDGPDNNGVYTNCVSSGDGLVAAQEYTDFLKNMGRPVVMLGILGVPEVTEHAMDPPFQPTAGGVSALVYRDWRDPEYSNGGDILPDDVADGKDAAYKQYEFGIGPGCTGEDGMGGFTGQAIPPVRVKEVCQSLDTQESIRCCIESICDTDFSDAIRCLSGLIQENVTPQG